MDSIKEYMEKQETEHVAHIIINNFMTLTGKELTDDEKEYAKEVSHTTFKKFVVTHKDDILVADAHSQVALAELLNKFTDSLSGLIVQFIYSRIEAYMLYKRVKELES